MSRRLARRRRRLSVRLLQRHLRLLRLQRQRVCLVHRVLDHLLLFLVEVLRECLVELRLSLLEICRCWVSKRTISVWKALSRTQQGHFEHHVRLDLVERSLQQTFLL